MTGIDRRRVRSSFQRGSQEYDQHTPVQMKVVAKLLQQLKSDSLPEKASLLDVGCGTGRLLEQLATTYPDYRLTGLDLAPAMLDLARERLLSTVQLMQGDAELLPFAAGSFDLVLSSSTFQWLDDLACCFQEVRRVLVDDGYFQFCFFGEGTLAELHCCWQRVLVSSDNQQKGQGGLHRFHTVSDVEGALKQTGFKEIRVESSLEQVWYPDLVQVLKAIKRIGAGTSRPLSGKGLGWRSVMQKVAELYQSAYGSEQGVPASYGVIYGVGRR